MLLRSWGYSQTVSRFQLTFKSRRKERTRRSRCLALCCHSRAPNIGRRSVWLSLNDRFCVTPIALGLSSSVETPAQSRDRSPRWKVAELSRNVPRRLKRQALPSTKTTWPQPRILVTQLASRSYLGISKPSPSFGWTRPQPRTARRGWSGTKTSPNCLMKTRKRRSPSCHVKKQNSPEARTIQYRQLQILTIWRVCSLAKKGIAHTTSSMSTSSVDNNNCLRFQL